MYGGIEVWKRQRQITSLKLTAYSLMTTTNYKQQTKNKKAGDKISPAFYIYGF